MNIRAILPLLALLAALAPLSGARATVVPAQVGAPRCFPEAPAITACIDGPIRAFWERQGGLPVFGYPLGPERNGVQRFERVRLERHPENPPPYDLLISRAGAEALARQGRDWQTFPKGDPAAPHYFPATGHAIAPQFWPYWSSHGLEFDGRPGTSFNESLALFGMPLSEPAMETNGAGETVLTQWFERARFEYHPDKPPAYRVLLGLLERESDAPADVFAAGGFIRPAGAQLVLNGQPVRLKGVNYYPQGRPWWEMWDVWDGVQMARELRQARDDLGINTVRILLPYSLDGSTEKQGIVNDDLLRGLRQASQIAGDLDLRLIVTLFDFYNDFAPAGTPQAARDVAYLRAVVGNFVGDDRIIAWDVHNEPDHYDLWQRGGAPQVLDWLGRMADEIHRLDPNHMVTVGIGTSENLWQAGPDGRTPLDYSDLVSAHIYNAGDVVRQLDAVRAHSGKPILLGEFGWPTGPGCIQRDYTEAEQVRVYRDTLAAADGRTVGALAWTLRDFDPGPTRRYDTREEHYGLYRPDGSLKPAAEALRAWPAMPLPSALRTSEPITAEPPNRPDGPLAPVAVPGSPFYVKGWFRQAWELLGGSESFGLPLDEAFVPPPTGPKDERRIQYFEGAVLEFHPEAAGTLGFERLLPPDKAKLMIVPLPIGQAAVAARGLPGGSFAVARVFKSFYKRLNGRWRFGAALTDTLVEDVDGGPATVQYFERGRLEVRADGHPQVSKLGAWAFATNCGG
jgi:hypothetical protein